MSLHTPANNVFLSKEETDAAILAVKSILFGGDTAAIDADMLVGVLFELTIARSHHE
jgi:hypothetical protein